MRLGPWLPILPMCTRPTLLTETCPMCYFLKIGNFSLQELALVTVNLFLGQKAALRWLPHEELLGWVTPILLFYQLGKLCREPGIMRVCPELPILDYPGKVYHPCTT